MKNIDSWKPTKFEIKNGKLKSTFNSQIVGHGSRLTAQLVADEYTQFIPKYCHGRLVDVGCGQLPFYGFYRDYVQDVTAVDWFNSVNMNEHIDVFADLNKPPVPGLENDSFDCAILSDVLEHIFEPRLLIGEIARILKPGGCLLMNVPFYYYIHEMPYDFHRYTEFALQRYFEEGGFDIVHLQRIGGVGACLISLTSKAVARLGMIGRCCTTLSQHFFVGTRHTFPFNKILTVGAERIPLGYFIVASKKSF
jgi:SAM-dependent methyltransferase